MNVRKAVLGRRSAGLAVLVASVVGVAWTAAVGSAGNKDVNYVANPPMIQGPKLSTIGPHVPGLGNDCSPLFGTPFPLGCYDPAQIRNALGGARSSNWSFARWS